MSAHWKSTPSHWCKFCHTYVRDSPLERKNHDSSGKHQNNIQRSLREIHKDKAREEREQQRAKDEVARLNGLVGGQGGGAAHGGIQGVRNVPAAPVVQGPKLTPQAQRKAHAEQLAAMGVELPDELKKEITGVGGWQTVAERVVEEEPAQSLADIVKREAVKKEEEIYANDVEGSSRGVHKRKAEDEERDARDEEAAPKKRAWGSSFKKFPGDKGAADDEDLDALLSDVKKKQPEVNVKEEVVKKEEPTDAAQPLADVPDINEPAASIKQEDGEGAPAVIFKKRKAKR